MHERHSRARERHVIEAYDGEGDESTDSTGLQRCRCLLADRLLRSDELSCRKRGNVNGVYDTVR